MLDKTIERFSGKKILVLGDMVADVYLKGKIDRISREAPVLVLQQAQEKVVAGGAANVVNNVASLGGNVFAVGVLGADNGGKNLRNILKENGAIVSGLIIDEKRPTITKTRIIAGGKATVSQQIVRIDNESHEILSKETETRLLLYLKETLPKVHGVIISDYGSKTVTERAKRFAISYAKEHNMFSMVDSRYDIKTYENIGFVKQNESELAAAMDKEFHSLDELKCAAQELLVKLNASGVLVTRGEDGMTLAKENGEIVDVPVSDKSEVFDVSGAGDTSVAAFMLSLCAGAAPEDAAVISNYASGIAVRKYGTATVSKDELSKVILKSV